MKIYENSYSALSVIKFCNNGLNGTDERVSAVGEWIRSSTDLDAVAAGNIINKAIANKEDKIDLSGLSLKSLPENKNICLMAVRGAPDYIGCLRLIPENILDELASATHELPSQQVVKYLHGEQIERRFNEGCEPVLVSSFSGKTSIDDFNINVLNEKSEQRKTSYRQETNGTVNFSGTALFKKCKDVLFGASGSNINNQNLIEYREDLLKELESCQVESDKQNLEIDIESLNDHISSKTLPNISFGAILSPDTIDVQNAFPCQHNTLGSRHKDIQAFNYKAFSSGITESGFFRDKHFKVNKETGEVIERASAKEDLAAIKKHIEKGRLADFHHIQATTQYDPNLSEVLFLPKGDYYSSISAIYIDLSSKFENNSAAQTNDYLATNKTQILPLFEKFPDKPIMCLFNNEQGDREMKQLSLIKENLQIN
ncbi:hypothetical protein SAMN05660489_06260 [Pseudomonas sp. LAMO17WK12:I10]|uniref:hypothetical protein n=1 Tax=unclassified Pseudomonas TaxID=196821 RepID=UPI000BD78C82|nr:MULTISPECIES: hypothetical protein [unclassified Pseudomonas]PXX51840.1 hypothetical protein H160_06280 [Pseudomonas sp. LAMO17WK12:I9]PXX60667.1 hypothetical protein H160_04343 [Pseudomonas sp. LAMO17WK12:I9]SNY53604.1 hypothetical protein SAMN05660489_06260 [Pseudomonas sp. LAMO17WK12:I10]